jgi:hypothetical protein
LGGLLGIIGAPLGIIGDIISGGYMLLGGEKAQSSSTPLPSAPSTPEEDESSRRRRSVQIEKSQDLEDYVQENTNSVLRRDTVDEVHTNIDGLKKRAPKNPGFLTAVLLSDPSSPAAKGVPLTILMQAATGTSGGRSNVIAPAPGAPGRFALVDTELGIVQVWRLDGLGALPRDGPRGKLQLTSLNAPGAASIYGSVRTSIVGEWHAPPYAVGDRNLNRPQDDPAGDYDEALTKRQVDSYFGNPIPAGRGCCANAIWLD